MDYSKENLDELFRYGEKILSALEDAANTKSDDLKNANRRFENLRENLQDILDKCED